MPNIIYVLTDDQGYGDLESFNPECKIPTPHLNRMAAEGMIFTDAYTTSSVCTPSRYGILTGRYNWRSRLKSGVLTGKSKALIPNDRTTIASLLQSRGYHTAFIGKWHLGWDWALIDGIDSGGEGWDATDFDNIDYTKPVANNPNDLGFSYFFGHSGSLDMAPYVYVENGMPTQVPDTVTVDRGRYTWWREGPTARDFVHLEVTPNFFQRSFDYIRDRAKTEKPFFLYLALPSPHTPILPTEEWIGKSDLNLYGDFVMMIDDYMGQLMEVISQAGIEENTILVFATDNGCSPQANFELLQAKGHYPSYVFRGHKADIFEGGSRIPYIIKWPAVIEKGSSTNAIVSTADFFATCAEISGYQLAENEGEDSFSMLPLFKNNNQDKFMREAVVLHSIDGSFAIRKEEWKLITVPGSGGWSFPGANDPAIDTLPPMQLYHLTDDPAETTNLFAKYPEKVEELKSLLIQYIANGRSTAGPLQKNDPIDFGWNQVSFMGQ